MIIVPRQARDKHRESTQKKRCVFLQGGLEHQPSEWPQWLQRRNKIPGISESAGAMWHDTRNQQVSKNGLFDPIICKTII
jgi:hypothetical protein